MNTRAKGILGESLAVNYLIKSGCIIMERNYSIRGGEIDIIFREGEITVFCEVKSRDDLRFGTPSEAVDYHKRRRIIRTASIYAQSNKLWDSKLRFDVIEVFGGDINHIKNAFQLN